MAPCIQLVRRAGFSSQRTVYVASGIFGYQSKKGEQRWSFFPGAGAGALMFPAAQAALITCSLSAETLGDASAAPAQQVTTRFPKIGKIESAQDANSENGGQHFICDMLVTCWQYQAISKDMYNDAVTRIREISENVHRAM